MRRIGLPLGDPAVWIEHAGRTTAIVRDLEMTRVRREGRVDEVRCPAELVEENQLDPDREIATAQALAAHLIVQGVDEVAVDRTLPAVFVDSLVSAGVRWTLDRDLGVVDRRSKSPDELEALRRCQTVTEDVMRLMCERVATADVDDDGRLIQGGEILNSDDVRRDAAIEFLRRGFSMTHGAIVATTPHVGDCHHAGTGTLWSGRTVVIDLFPRDESSRFWGDCTRTVVHGRATPDAVAMAEAVGRAKAAAIEAMGVGVAAADVHRAATDTLKRAGYSESRGSITREASIQHGTGHGIGLDLHEPILLDAGAGPMVENEVFTVEPGLYGSRVGGVRIEDMVAVTPDGPVNFNRLPEGLDWA